ncbi:MAG: hypothetical protein JOS17DRAFT_109864 [Linnemannia elongata]|nr:MAG: hypothetical protein JOS17DRAFT_109864 [Linnemannia elongata]
MSSSLSLLWCIVSFHSLAGWIWLWHGCHRWLAHIGRQVIVSLTHSYIPSHSSLSLFLCLSPSLSLSLSPSPSPSLSLSFFLSFAWPPQSTLYLFAPTTLIPFCLPAIFLSYTPPPPLHSS